MNKAENSSGSGPSPSPGELVELGWGSGVKDRCALLIGAKHFPMKNITNAALFNSRKLKESTFYFKSQGYSEARAACAWPVRFFVSTSVYISHSITLTRIIHIYMLRWNANFPVIKARRQEARVSQRPKRDRLIWKFITPLFRTTQCDSVSPG